MDHRVFWFATRGQCIKGKKLDCFEHKFCFKLQCASIVVLLCTAIWWKLKDAVVHCLSYPSLGRQCFTRRTSSSSSRLIAIAWKNYSNALRSNPGRLPIRHHYLRRRDQRKGLQRAFDCAGNSSLNIGRRSKAKGQRRRWRRRLESSVRCTPAEKWRLTVSGFESIFVPRRWWRMFKIKIQSVSSPSKKLFHTCAKYV